MQRANEQLGPLPVARSFERASAAVEAILAQLSATGLGTWTVVSGEHAASPPAGTVTIPLGGVEVDHPLALRLERPGAHPLCDDVRGSVHLAARLVATLLGADASTAELTKKVAQAERESATDALTGLGNARSWWRMLSREAARCDRFGLVAVVVVIDLDELKLINDRNGHLAGDNVLRAAAHTLNKAVRAEDFVARLGGDEFAVLAVDYEAPAPDLLVNRLRDALTAAGVSASMGAALYEPGGQINDVFHEADQHMYAAKRERSGCR
jgi:diguanylate cyclase (GGDEF)-like protein